MELSAAEGRVLGCLIEQEALAPDAGPITLNTLRLACNQTTGRDPVVAFDDRRVEDTLLSLKSRGLARFVSPSGTDRTTRYRHRADERWRMGSAELAVLAVLLLGGVQTVAEVRAQVQQLDPLIGPAEVDAVLDTLAARTPKPFAARVPRRAGDHQARWVEVLTSAAPTDEAPGAAPGNGGDGAAMLGRVSAELTSPSYADLVARVADLERRLTLALEQQSAAAAAAARALPATPVAGGAGTDWAAAALGPAPPIELGASRSQVAIGSDSRSDESRRVGTDIADLTHRIGDIERRLARIEAELGALR
jgi:uncharacterized protein YceH (UPF0502 family)